MVGFVRRQVVGSVRSAQRLLTHRDGRWRGSGCAQARVAIGGEHQVAEIRHPLVRVARGIAARASCTRAEMRSRPPSGDSAAGAWWDRGPSGPAIAQGHPRLLGTTMKLRQALAQSSIHFSFSPLSPARKSPSSERLAKKLLSAFASAV